jgi:flagellar FliL protein
MTTTSPPPIAGDRAEAGGGRRTALVLVVVLAVVAGAAWWFLRPFSGGEEEPVPGEVLTLEAVQVNLADGHFLRVGLALQLVEGAEHVDGSQALDATIDLFSGQDMAELAGTKARHRLKEELLRQIEVRYHHQVLALYFTEFVMQ